MFESIKEKIACLRVPQHKKIAAAAWLFVWMNEACWAEGCSVYDTVKQSYDAAGKKWMDHFTQKVNEAFAEHHNDKYPFIPYTFHFQLGMDIRNEMRSNGFGEKELGIENLDYIYDELIQMAMEI